MKKFLFLFCLFNVLTAHAEMAAPAEVYDYQSLMGQAETNPALLQESIGNGVYLTIQPSDYKQTTYKNIFILSKGEHVQDPQKIKLLGLYFDIQSRPALKGKKTANVFCAQPRAKIDQSILISLEQCKVL